MDAAAPRTSPLRVAACAGLLLLSLSCLLADGAPALAANYEDIVLANKVVARIRDCGPFDNLWQRAGKINKNINDAFECEDVGHPRMWMAYEGGRWTVYIGKVRLLSVLPGDAAGAGRTEKSLAGIWMANFRQRFPEAEPVIHMDDPFGTGSTGPRGPGHTPAEDPNAPLPERHDEDLPAEVRSVLDAFDAARANRADDVEAADRQLAQDLLRKLNLGGPPPDEDRALGHLLSAFIWVRRLPAATFEAKRVRGAELALERLRQCLKPLRRTAQNDPPPPPPGKISPEYRTSVGDVATLALRVAGPAGANDENGNPLLSAQLVASADLTAETVEVKEDSFVVRVSVANAKVTANDAKLPLERDSGEGLLEVDRHGRVLKAEVADLPDLLGAGEQGMGLLAGVLSLGRFTGEPVGVGDSWAFDQEAQVGDKPMKIHFETQVAAIEQPLLRLVSNATADVPALPLKLFGGNFPLRGGTLKLEQVEREFDYEAGVPGPTRGRLLVDLDSELEGTNIKIQAQLDLSLGPAEPEAEEAPVP